MITNKKPYFYNLVDSIQKNGGKTKQKPFNGCLYTGNWLKLNKMA